MENLLTALSLLLATLHQTPNVPPALAEQANMLSAQVIQLSMNQAFSGGAAEPAQAIVTSPKEGDVWNAKNETLRVLWDDSPATDKIAPPYARIDLEGDFGQGPEERIVLPLRPNTGSATIFPLNIPAGNYRLFVVGLPGTDAGPDKAWSLAMPQNITVK